MLIPTIVMGILALVCVLFAYQKGEGAHIIGLRSAGTMLIQLLPLLIFAFIIAAIIPQLVSQEAISRWVGTESGFRGILIGTVAGGLLPGGPYVVMPLLAGFLQVGASAGTMVALVTGWSLLAFSRVPIEIAVLGWKFWLVRLACTFYFAPIAGLIANKLFSNIKLL